MNVCTMFTFLSLHSRISDEVAGFLSITNTHYLDPRLKEENMKQGYSFEIKNFRIPSLHHLYKYLPVNKTHIS